MNKGKKQKSPGLIQGDKEDEIVCGLMREKTGITDPFE